MKLVMKFGGTSVGDGDRIKRVANIVSDLAEKGNRLVVVASAMSGVTDELYELSLAAERGDEEALDSHLKNLRERHHSAVSKAIRDAATRRKVLEEIGGRIEELEKVLAGISYLGELSPRSKDYVLSFGERLSTPILWGALLDLGLEAKYLTGWEAGIVTDSNYGRAKPLMSLAAQRILESLEPLLARGIIPVVTGYIAKSSDGIVTTLSRGGSDYTATILGAALNVDEVWIWSDVDGVMTTDPRAVGEAVTIPVISYAEATEMAYFGAKVLHPLTLIPVMEKDIPVRIKNTFNPESPGTLIVRERKIRPSEIVKAVTYVSDVSAINVESVRIGNPTEAAASVFSVLAKNRVNALMFSQGSSNANISIVIPRQELRRALSTLQSEVGIEEGGNEVKVDEEVCVVAVVGEGMRGTPGVAARVFKAVASKGINVMMIAQGASELNISFVVKESDGIEAVRTLHKEFKLEESAVNSSNSLLKG